MSWATVLELAGLRVEVRARPSYFDRWFDCRITADASPFGGVVETIYTDEDLVDFAEALDGLDPVGEVMLGGGRATELRLVIANQVGGRDGALAIECTLTPSGDDPYPLLRWIIFDAAPFAREATRRLRESAALDPWPSP
jgi:hypothetical protein